MFRKMRRNEKEIEMAKVEELLKSEDYGILGVIGDGGYPYTVPLNYAYDNGKIYFHSTSMESHKIESIEKDNKVSFTVVTEHDLIPEKLDTNYTSIIAFGKAKVLRTKEEIMPALKILLDALSPEMAKTCEKVYTSCENKFVMIEIDVEKITGKLGR